MADWVNIVDVLDNYFLTMNKGSEQVNVATVSQQASSDQAIRFHISGVVGDFMLCFYENDSRILFYDVANSKSLWNIFGTEVNSLQLSTSDISPASTQGGTWAKVDDIADGISTWEKIA